MCKNLTQRQRNAMSTAKVCLTAVLVLVAACSHRNGDIGEALAKAGNGAPEPAHFNVCHAHGCAHVSPVSLKAHQWAQVRATFEGVEDAADERRRLRAAIALLERWTGEQTGTDRDIGGSFPGFGRGGQMDCIDEMVNTGTYIRMLESDGLLVHHRLDSHEYLGFFETAFWPHAAVAIREAASGKRFVVDSWWLDNGAPPYVVAYDEWWEGGWRERYDAKDKAAAEEAQTDAAS